MTTAETTPAPEQLPAHPQPALLPPAAYELPAEPLASMRGFPGIQFWMDKFDRLLFGAATSQFLNILLEVMEFAFKIDRSYRRNIQDFKGRYVICTADGSVYESIIFQDGKMDASHRVIDDWNVKVVYKNAGALRSFLFAQDADVLDSLLKNEVEVSGNINYVHRFGFLARDLQRRLLG